MDEKGADAGLFMIKPSFENFKCPHFGWKLSHRCVRQRNEFDGMTMKA